MMRMLALALTAVLASAGRGAEVISLPQRLTRALRDMDLSSMSSGEGEARRDANCYGGPLSVGGKTYGRGVGVHAPSRYELKVAAGAVRSFRARVGVVDAYANARKGTVRFRVYADGRAVSETETLRFGGQPVEIRANLEGARVVGLSVSDDGDGIANDLAAWLDAEFEVDRGTTLAPVDPAKAEQIGILTPPTPDAPQINPPRVFGVRPEHPVLFTVPASGRRPLRYAATGLPPGVSLDASSGKLSGSVTSPGDYRIRFSVANDFGRDEREFRLVVGNSIALTPPMGWNSWNCFADAVTERDIRSAAEALVRSGLRDFGWSYVNIDDFWQNHSGISDRAPDIVGPLRKQDGSVIVNKRFGDMKDLTDYVHGLGLKIGLYSSPGPLTCGGCAGSFGHEERDAAQYAAWGFDYLKYDWCSYDSLESNRDIKSLMAPYLKMGRALARQDRDIVFSLCQYGMGNVSTWGAVVGGQCWRTTSDIKDVWGVVLSFAGRHDGLEHFSGPGAWNDPDMLVVGQVGWGPKLHPTRLTRNEQYAHMTLWSMLAAPLLLGCDLTRLDSFTRGLLTNAEVLEINQDELGEAGARVRCDGWNEGVWVRPLANGDFAVALVNISSFPRRVSIDLKRDLGLVGRWRVRDVWRQWNEGTVADAYSAAVPVHAAHLVRLRPLPGAGLAAGVADCRDRAWERHLGERGRNSPCAGCDR